MKLKIASSLILLCAASALGQHAGGGHATGGSFSHSSSGSFSGRSYAAPSFSASRTTAIAPVYRANYATQQPRYQYNSPTGSAPFGGAYPYGERAGGNRYPGNRYRPAYSRGIYLGGGWIGTGLYDYGYPTDTSDQQGAPADAYTQGAPGPDGDPQGYGPMLARPPYEPETAGATDLQEQPQLTLLFKDGRPAQQVQNYALTQTTLYVLDGGRRREIPLDQLDLPLTEKTNREAGVDFEVPAG